MRERIVLLSVWHRGTNIADCLGNRRARISQCSVGRRALPRRRVRPRASIKRAIITPSPTRLYWFCHLPPRDELRPKAAQVAAPAAITPTTAPSFTYSIAPVRNGDLTTTIAAGWSIVAITERFTSAGGQRRSPAPDLKNPDGRNSAGRHDFDLVDHHRVVDDSNLTTSLSWNERPVLGRPAPVDQHPTWQPDGLNSAGRQTSTWSIIITPWTTELGRSSRSRTNDQCWSISTGRSASVPKNQRPNSAGRHDFDLVIITPDACASTPVVPGETARLC